MIRLRLPNRGVTPADFGGRRGVCQNLLCLAPLEPPYHRLRLGLPGAALETVVCTTCLPPSQDGTCPELSLQVVAAGPVLAPPPAADPPGPTFAALAELEPRLLELLAEARAHHGSRDPDFCANAFWYGYPGHRPGLKGRLCRLVGCTAEKGGDLRTPAAYDVAYHTIYWALPDCCGRCLRSGVCGI
jgi:hypothetical protein